MGTASLFVFVAFAMFFAAGARIFHLVAILAVTVPVAAISVMASPYRRARIFAFVDPWKDPQNYGFHIVQSLLALGSGGLFGMGLGASRAKFFYLAGAVHRFHLFGSGRGTRPHRRVCGRRSFRNACLPRRQNSDCGARSFWLLHRHWLRRDDRHSGLYQHRRRDVVVAGDRRPLAVHLLRRQFFNGQLDCGSPDRQRRTPPSSECQAVAPA